uniref:Protein CPR-5 n=1 Tax=Anthurium amnicola TaxID=1678845 RepID=A0A1D1ZLT5_9ARAE
MEASSGGLRPPREGDNGVPDRAEAAAGGPDRAVEVVRPSEADEGMKWSREKGRRASPSSEASSSSSASSSRRMRGGGVHLRRRTRAPSRGGGRGGDGLQDLGLPLGMSFAAVVAKVLDGKIVDGERIPADRLSLVCSMAVKEAVENFYGRRCGNFMRNFENSFCCTLKTLQVIQEEYFGEQRNHNSHLRDCPEDASTQGMLESLDAAEDVQEHHLLNSADNQLILQADLSQQLALISQKRTRSGFSQSVFSTLEKSVMEQSRSNDLKAFEIGLTIKKLQMKKSELELSSYANFLERIKLSMGISKASFKEEKLKNQIQDFRHAELVRRCIDLLVSGMILMSCLLVYGAYIYSYKRITDATGSCITTNKEPKSWWVPKQVNSGWLSMRCHVVVISRMFFGLLMILAVAYSVFQRSASSGSAMPITFILLLLGVACGAAGKFCIDTLGGNGYYWLLYWEIFCLLHFFANAFPSALYYILHGPISVSPVAKKVLLPYWVRRFTFYTIVVLILPMFSGLLPFASLYEWKEHIVSKLIPLSFGVGD